MIEHKLGVTNKNLSIDMKLLGPPKFKFEKILIGTKDYILDMEYAYLSTFILLDNMYNSNTGGSLNGGTFGEGHGNTDLTDTDVLKIRELHNLDSIKYTPNTLSKIYNIEPTSISKILRGFTWKHLNNVSTLKEIIPTGRLGTSRDKLTLEDARKIRELYATGKYTYQDIADLFGNIVKKLAIGKIVRNERWVEL
jgi:hypothetical protein